MSYTRSYPGALYVLDEYAGSGFCPSSSLNGSSTTRTLLSWSNTKSGASNPFRKHQIRNGDNASTDYSLQNHEVAVDGVHCSVTWTEQAFNCPTKKRGTESRRWNAAGFVVEPSNPDLIPLTNADNQARTRAYSRIRSIQTAFQGGTWVGELGDTLRLIKGRSKGFYRGILDYATDAKKRRRGENAAGLVRRASDLWLERSFGWIPLLSDIRGANNYLKRKLESPLPLYEFKGSGFDDSVTVTPGAASRSDRLCVKFVKNRATHARVAYYGKVDGGPQNSPLLYESRLLGFDPSNWIPTLWELIPYSFLVDYFTNTGDVISSWTTCTTGVRWCSKSYYKAYETSISDVKWDIDAVKARMGSAYSLFNPSGTASASGTNRVARVSKGRVKGVVLSPPRLTFDIPGLSMKWLNMTALATARSFGR